MMKKNKKSIGMIIIIIFILNGFNVFVYSQENNNLYEIKETFKISKPILHFSGEFVTIDFNESESFYSIPGKPILPIIKKTYTFPLGTIIKNMSIAYKSVELSLTRKIIPTPLIEIVERYHSENQFYINESSYGISSLFPEKNYYIRTGGGIQNNERVLFYTINFIPQYNPLEDKIYIPRLITIEIDYVLPKSCGSYSNQYDMVIISSESFSSNLQSLIEHKNSVGIRTYMKTLESIYSDYNANTSREKIKLFIRDSIEQYNIKYVLMIGDLNSNPYGISDGTFFGSRHYIYTDLYYADVYDANGTFNDWDSNNDGIIGEWIWDHNKGVITFIDEIDLYPDIGIGRLPVENENELDIVIQKLIHYEQTPSNDDWFNRLILMAGDDFPNHGIYEGEWVTEQIANNMQKKGFNPIKLWTSTNNFNLISIIREFNAGAGFISYSGHGASYGIKTFLPNTEIPKIFYWYHIFLLKNHEKLPVFFLDACSTADPEGFSRFGFQLPCFAWDLVKYVNGGAICSIGATMTALMATDQVTGIPLYGPPILNMHFFDAYETGSTISDLFIHSKKTYISSYMKDPLTIMEYILIGDPSLKIGGYNYN